MYSIILCIADLILVTIHDGKMNVKFQVHWIRWQFLVIRGGLIFDSLIPRSSGPRGGAVLIR